MKVDFTRIFDTYVGSNQKTWAHDRSQTVGASEAFACIRQTFYKKHAYPQDETYEQSWGALERGNVMENSFVEPALRHAFGDNLIMAGSDQHTLVLGRNSATPDGLVINQARDALQQYGIDDISSDCFCIEIKSVDPRVDIRKEKAIHRGQTQQQMGLLRDTTKYKPRFSVVLYVDASFYDVITPHIVEFDPKVWRTAKARADSVWKSNDPLQFMPEGRFDGSCDLCAWRRTCMGDTLSAIPEEDKKRDKNSPPELIDEADPLVREYELAANEAKESELRKQLASETLKDFLRKRDRRKVKAEDWSVSYYPVKGAAKIDLDALRSSGIDLEPFTTQQAGHDQLRVTFG